MDKKNNNDLDNYEDKQQLKLLATSWLQASERLKSKNLYLRDFRGYATSTRKIGNGLIYEKVNRKEKNSIFVDFNLLIYLFPFHILENSGSLICHNYDLQEIYYLNKLVYLERRPPKCLVKKMLNDYIYPSKTNAQEYIISLRVGIKVRTVLTYNFPLCISALFRGFILWSGVKNKEYLFSQSFNNDVMSKNIKKYTNGMKLSDMVGFLKKLKGSGTKIEYSEDKSERVEDFSSEEERSE